MAQKQETADVHVECASLWPRSTNEIIPGTRIYLTPLQAAHADSLYPHVSGEPNASLWVWMPHGPFDTLSDFRAYMQKCASSTDTCFWAIVDKTSDQILGHTSFLRIDPANGVVEIGHIMYSPLLQKTIGATEAWFLLAERAFASGFRRLEWKCNALNEPSRRAALRYGHTFEGIFRQHMIAKGKNRDTAWFSIIDGEWPGVKRAVEVWRDESNFDEAGRQKMSLAACRDSLQ